MNTSELTELFYVEDSGIHGKGLFTRIAVARGRHLGTYLGPETTDMENAGPHVLWVEDEDGKWIGRDGQNVLRYLNHHDEPSAEFDGFELYALKDIPPGAEITIHYGEEFVESIVNGEV